MVWNIIPTKVRISKSIPNFNSNTNCSLCFYPTDSLYPLFFTCTIARLSGLASIFWPLDTTILNVANIRDWLHIILHPECRPGLPHTEIHRFQIFATIACDFLWFTRNKAYHDGLLPYAFVISTTINRIDLEHFSAWIKKIQSTS